MTIMPLEIKFLASPFLKVANFGTSDTFPVRWWNLFETQHYVKYHISSIGYQCQQALFLLWNLMKLFYTVIENNKSEALIKTSMKYLS